MLSFCQTTTEARSVNEVYESSQVWSVALVLESGRNR